MATQDQAGAGATSTRDAIRWGFLLAAIAVAGFRLPRAFGDLRQWLAIRRSDASAADFYRKSFEVSAVGIALILCIGIGLFYLLRRRAQH